MGIKDIAIMGRRTGMEEGHIDLKGLDAFILDMDGVVTNTARVHATAWKQTFDEYLEERARRYGEAYEPFDAERDYLYYVDGKPRCDGVKSFLDSRHISLPQGSPDDPPEQETVCGIGNRKNVRFVQWLEAHGAEPYPSTLELIRRLRSHGVRFALISASRNAKKVLQTSGLSDLFEVVVDGADAAELGLRGKPAPDVLLEAARRLGVTPGRAALVEDALAGVEAGRAAGFAVVIGVDRGNLEDELRKHGADTVVKDLSELPVDGEKAASSAELPSAMEHLDDIFKRLRQGVPTIFLDYDGTLTPIVREPAMAVLSERMRDILSDLAHRCLVCIVSGRDVEDIRKRVGIKEIIYVGSHGFETIGPGGAYSVQEQGKAFLPALDQAEGELKGAIKDIQGAWVERKRFAIAMHYRMVDEKDLPSLEGRFDEVAQRFPTLRKTGGKKVFELRPNLDWDKGKAVNALLGKHHVNGSRTVPVYIGDDDTDEDAFRALGDQGITILVSDQGRSTAANYVLKDVSEVFGFLEGLIEHFEREVAGGVWALTYDRYEPEKEQLRESLCTVGNGYFASRGAAPESAAGTWHYPGTYLAGLYNRLTSEVFGLTIENESMVNVPNWLCLSFRHEDGDWFDLSTVEVQEFRQELDMRQGTLNRMVSFADARGRRTRVVQRRLVSMDSPHLAGLETTVIPENWSGSLKLRSALDGRVENTLVVRYRLLNNHHLDQLGNGTLGKDTVWLQVETNQSHVRVAEAARTRVFQGDEMIGPDRRTVQEPGYIGQELDLAVEEGRPVRIEKIVTVHSSRDRAISESLIEALQELHEAADFRELAERHGKIWNHLWDHCRIDVSADHGRIAQVLNLHIFHLLQTVSPSSIDLDVGVPPRGLHGEGYRGLIMWDEIFILPFLDLHLPHLSRSLLLYRYRRLPRARWAAKQAGYQGAQFPWQSGSDGREEGQTVHLNPVSGQWIPDYSHLERHISLAIAYNVWQYYQVTGDLDFMTSHGAEMLVEIARYWASKARYSPSRRRYEILKVMGPDEFHERYPDSPEPGIDNNAYTNLMATWVLRRAIDALRILPLECRREVWEALSVQDEELSRWDEISRKMYIPFHGDGVISQFEGYDDLKELDWDAYRRKYGNVHRLDRILKAEGDSPDRYKVSKQADVLMLFYLLSADELGELLDRLGYRMDRGTIPRTIDYYMKRTSHGSTLSSVVHAWVLSRSNREMSWNLFLEALNSDIADTQGGTTHEGIHLGAMAGTVDIIQRCYSGLETRGEVLWFDPSLPMGLERLKFDIDYRRHRIAVEIDKRRLRLVSRPQDIAPVSIGFKGDVRVLAPGGEIEYTLD